MTKRTATRCGVRWAPLAVGLLLVTAAPAGAGRFDHDLYDRVLAGYTRATDDVAGVRVDYARLRTAPEWPRLLASLAAVDLAALTEAERFALWINAYNVLAIDVVRRHWPLESIRDVGSLWSPVWKREAGVVAGRTVTLHEIEHEILRPLGDPRIHGAIVCASTSCPSLRRESFRAARLDAQLDDTLRGWLANPQKGARVAADGVRVSKIFDWFEEDFAAGGGVLAFVRRYLADDARAALDALGPSPGLSYFDDDWNVNAL